MKLTYQGYREYWLLDTDETTFVVVYVDEHDEVERIEFDGEDSSTYFPENVTKENNPVVWTLLQQRKTVRRLNQ